MYNKLSKAMHNLHKNERGMTGLETAIILIAFVTVAAVFGYAVLSAGLFSAERGKETIYAGLQQAKSNLELSGSVVAKSSDNTTVGTVLFTVRNAIAGNPIDLTPNSGGTAGQNKCVISLTTADNYYNNITWTTTSIGADDGDNLLEAGEQFEISVDISTLSPACTLGTNDFFSFQIKPSMGSTITVMRTLPAGLDPVMDMH
jgi:archaeal flagellin FlaB